MCAHQAADGTGEEMEAIRPNPMYEAGSLRDSERPWRLDKRRFEAARIEPGEHNHGCLRRMTCQEEQNAVDGYYRRQNEMIDGFSEMDALEEHLLPTDAENALAQKLARSEWFAIQVSNIANVVLLAAKVFCSIQSQSLAIIASALDSLLDLLSGFILWFTARSMRIDNPYKYPIGKKRMQPLGIIVFASIMAMLGLQVLVEGIKQLVQGHSGDVLGDKWPWAVGIMLGATFSKLALFLYCNSFQNEIVKAYAKDHFFDVITNIIGLAAALLADALVWWIDPAGAILLALYTMTNWGSTVLENVNSLTGETAPPDFLQKLTYLCWNHHEAVIQIDTVRAYTFGSHYFCEVDIVLPAGMPLQNAHDIGEALQNKLERLPEIERAFVHLDYEVSHRPEHHGFSTFRMTETTPAGQVASTSPPSGLVADSPAPGAEL
eukprot:jgi/Mesen1/826/ME000111S10966